MANEIERFYRALLRLLPFEFRAEFGRDMQQAFAEERDDVRSRRSVAATLRFWLRTATDFARTAPRQHWDVLRQDLRVGARLLTRNPGFAITVVLTLALGIGGSASIFSVVYAVALRPLGFPESERVVRIGWATDGERALLAGSYRDLATLRDHATAFDAIGGMRHDNLASEKGTLLVPIPSDISVGGVGASFVMPQMASASLFKVFGATTVLGRLPDERDEQPGAAPIALLSYSTWTSHYGRDPGVIGRHLVRRLGGGRSETVIIVGVLSPDAFAYPYRSNVGVPAWASLDDEPIRDARGVEVPYISIYARLAPGVSLEAARAQVAALTPHLVLDRPQQTASSKSSLEVALLRDQIVGVVKAPLLVFLAAVSCLLLVACVNVTSLVLARAIARRQEFAARFALGARPLRIARQLLTESAMLALAGGAVGLLFAWLGRRAFVAISPSMPRLEESGIDVPTLMFAIVGVLIATCVAGVVPALMSSRRSVADGLRRAGGAAGTATMFSRPLATLGAAEIALVLVLLTGAGLLVNSFARLMLFDLGFESRSVIMLTVERTLTQAPAVKTPQRADEQAVAVLTDRQRQMIEIDNDVVQRVSGIAGVVATAMTGDDPFGPPYRYSADLQLGDARTRASAAWRIASPRALDALRLQLIAGRWFTSDDRDGTPNVAVVNRAMARRFWNERNPVGDRIVFGRRVVQIIGLVADVRERGAREEARPVFYVSTTQIPPDPTMLVIRTASGVKGMENVVAAELAQMRGRITAHSPRRPEDIRWRQVADARFITLVLSVFSVIALAIALAGVHGILRFLVAQRTREMGIRKALGATGGDLVRLVLGHALRFALPGCLVGLMAAAFAGPAIRSLLFGITPTDPLTLVAVTASLVGAVLVGAYFPARRASAVDPALSLRTE
jgi:predicted permease